MPLYRVLVEYEALVWSENIKTKEVAEDVGEKYLHDIMQDQNTMDATIRVARVTKPCQVPTGWMNGIPYGQRDTINELTVGQLLESRK